LGDYQITRHFGRTEIYQYIVRTYLRRNYPMIFTKKHCF
jgi:hypothetical protein